MEKKKKTQIINNNENDRKTSPEKRLSIKKLKKENNENKLSTPLLSNNQKQLRYSFKPKTAQLKLLLNDKKENKDSRQVFSNTLKSHNRKSIDENNSNSNTFDNNHKRTGSEQLKFKKEEIKIQNKEIKKNIKNYNILNVKNEKKAKTTQKTSPRKKFFSNNLINTNINNNNISKNLEFDNININNNISSKDFSMSETLNIISEIQKHISHIIKDNNKPLNIINKILNKDYLNIYNYVPLSENQKKNISDDIERTSELRIQNYETAFNFINNSLNSIQKFFKNYLRNEENQDLNEARLFFDFEKDNETDKEDFDKLKISSSSDDDGSIIFQNDDNYTNNIITPKKNSNKNNFEETDFHEELSENTKIIPPNNLTNEKFNIRNKNKKLSLKQPNNMQNFYTKHRTVIIKEEDEIKELMNKLANQSNNRSDFFRTKTVVTPKKIFTEENEEKENTINVERSASKKECAIF